MKRSEINQALKNMEEMIRKCGFHLPPFCDFTPDEWKEKGHEYDEIRDNMLGWDITDYGLGNFKKIGSLSEMEIRIWINIKKHMRKSFFIWKKISPQRCISTGQKWKTS